MRAGSPGLVAAGLQVGGGGCIIQEQSAYQLLPGVGLRLFFVREWVKHDDSSHLFHLQFGSRLPDSPLSPLSPPLPPIPSPPPIPLYLSLSLFPPFPLPLSLFTSPSACRRHHPVIRRQQVHEGAAASGDAHRGGGRLVALPLPAGLRRSHGNHVPKLGRHTASGAGRRPRPTHCQPGYTHTLAHTYIHTHTSIQNISDRLSDFVLLICQRGLRLRGGWEADV